LIYAATAICAGYAVYYNAKAMVYHSHSYSVLRTLKRYFNIGRFFADNRGVLQYAGLKSYGIGMLGCGAQTFWQKRSPHNIAALAVDLTIKTIGYKLGWYYQLLHRKNER
jgi:rhamnosyltransferase